MQKANKLVSSLISAEFLLTFFRNTAILKSQAKRRQAVADRLGARELFPCTHRCNTKSIRKDRKTWGQAAPACAYAHNA